MKNIILCEKLYGDIDSFTSMFKDMMYEETQFGNEILNFNFIPQGLDLKFKKYTFVDVEIQPNTGIFRKPNKSIHVEPFYQHCLWICIVALEDTVLSIWENEDAKNVFESNNKELDQEKWILNKQINMKKNEFVFIRPWLWYSLEENNLVQIFLLNQKLEEKEDD